jgi:REP element-mobilizing transposase RayT
MSTFTQLTYQVVFGGKNHNIFLPENTQDQLFAYMGGILKNLGCMPYTIGGHLDHVHMVYSATGKYSVGKIVQEIKTSTNIFMHDRHELFPDFTCWQVGYGGFHIKNLIWID